VPHIDASDYARPLSLHFCLKFHLSGITEAVAIIVSFIHHAFSAYSRAYLAVGRALLVGKTGIHGAPGKIILAFAHYAVVGSLTVTVADAFAALQPFPRHAGARGCADVVDRAIVIPHAFARSAHVIALTAIIFQTHTICTGLTGSAGVATFAAVVVVR
jgi:hypothetical protein